MKAKVFIATPTTGGIVKAPYATTLAGTTGRLVAAGISVDASVLSATDVGRQRDALVAQFLADPANTHLLFIDSDIQAPPDLALHMLALDRPFIGAIYAKKEKELAFVAHIREGTEIINGLCRAEWIGFGYVLLRRDCLDMMQERCTLHRYKNRYRHDAETLGFFASIDDCSEDISFCRRWTVQCGQPLWAYAAADIKHIGDYFYGVPFTDYVRNNQANAAALDGSKA
jgi:hypothetical protein